MNESYTADGLRRSPTTWSGSASSVDLSVSAGVTRQGYTWQTALGNMGLNHMNGRVEDAITGVFLSPDPYISEPGNPQNYNRYSYVLNNPLSFTDPSGYRRKKKTGNISKKNQPPKYTLEEVLVTAERYEPHYLSDILDTVNFGRDLINGIADFLDRLVNSYFNSSQSGGDGKNTGEREPQTQKPVDCNTSLPNGTTVGDSVRDQRAQLDAVENAGFNSGGFTGFTFLNKLAAFFRIAQPNGPIDFKNNFRGQENSRTLGDAGNFAYYASGSGYLPNIVLDAGAGGYGLYSAARGQKQFSQLTGPMYSDQSAARMRNPGLNANGCSTTK